MMDADTMATKVAEARAEAGPPRADQGMVNGNLASGGHKLSLLKVHETGENTRGFDWGGKDEADRFTERATEWEEARMKVGADEDPRAAMRAAQAARDAHEEASAKVWARAQGSGTTALSAHPSCPCAGAPGKGPRAEPQAPWLWAQVEVAKAKVEAFEEDSGGLGGSTPTRCLKRTVGFVVGSTHTRVWPVRMARRHLALTLHGLSAGPENRASPLPSAQTEPRRRLSERQR